MKSAGSAVSYVTRKEAVTKQEQIQPQYADAFRCIGSACTDTCCVGWQVVIDRETYEKYKALPDLLPILDARISVNQPASDADYARVKLKGNRCPFLAEDRLCDIQKKYGAEYLSETCTQYPRSVRVDRTVTKKTLLLSCPEAARITLLNPNLLRDEEIGGGTCARYRSFCAPKNESSRKKVNALDCIWRLQLFSVVLLKDRRYALWQRLFILGMFCSRLHELSLTKQADGVVTLLDNYSQMIIDKSLISLMSAIPARPEIQLNVAWKFAERALQRSEGISFRESLADFRAAIALSGGAPESSTIAAYEAAHNQYYLPLMDANPFLLENYLTNYILQRGFLSLNREDSKPHDIRTDYFVMCTHLSVIRTMLIGIAGHYREQFGTEQVVKLVQGFSKAAEHDAVFMGEVAKFISDTGLNRPGQIATLLA
jgi:lysine-N-methylase